MNLFDQHDYERNSHERISDMENNKNFTLIVTLISLLTKSFYTPVSFLIEYIKNKPLQILINEHTGYNKFNFIILFLRNFPNVAKSKRLRNVVEGMKEHEK